MSPEEIKDLSIDGKLVFQVSKRNPKEITAHLTNAAVYLWRDVTLHWLGEGGAQDGQWPGFFKSVAEADSMLSMLAKRLRRQGIYVEVIY